MNIGTLLLQCGLITPQQLEIAQQQAPGQRIDQALVQMGILREEDSLRLLSNELGMPFVDLKEFNVDRELLNRFPTSAIFRHEAVPLERENGHVRVAVSDPFDLEAIDELSTLGGVHIQPVLACRNEILDLIKRNLGVGGDTIKELVAQRNDEVDLLDEIPEGMGELAESAQAPSVIRLVNELLIEALDQRASDIHLEPQESGLVVRFRVDGLLRVQPVPPEINHFASSIVTRLKIMSRLNIAEKRLPQDGRINVRVQRRDIDVRVSIIPMLHGEGVVLRLLDKQRMTFSLLGVGMPQDTYEKFQQLITLPHGIILVTGPTGSGKTTTLYSALSEIKDPSTKIITVEDPVEYHLNGISQIQVHAKIGMTFAAGLRSILRHDPDVVLIGEIRDGETATSAIQASLTGHLVFSTLHTNDAPGSFTRLVDMGVEPYLVASTVEGILAQRLLRKLCPRCKRPKTFLPEDLPSDFPALEAMQLYEPGGCRDCRDTGYTGRTGVHELLVNDEEIRHLCNERASTGVIRTHALKKGMVSLRMAGFRKVLDGTTTMEEVMRITRGDLG
ncbi:general secretion pathway protein E/type IV pilus assembly protein PilB [Planctomicrobium piriforme]|uniref:General secretion pathway protein E/type IV pilus assembly protein PilB n=2 Tax=Planctomicrobium piriforme TaxID=1576369 RepID=A0A1I3IJ74_9PLAN|nr:general secretion pathway protein E/type IV pilus assembly protein PilB [Planctomicrobium piriforme]